MTIDCGLCILRPYRSGDAAALAHSANDVRIANNLRDRFPSPYTHRDADEWIARTMREQPAQNLAIALDDVVVGGIGSVPGFDHTELSCEVGYWLGADHWGRGIVTAALNGFTPYLFDEFGYARLFAAAYSRNLASQRVLEKCGFVREGVLRDSETKGGRLVDMVMYALLGRDRRNVV